MGRQPSMANNHIIKLRLWSGCSTNAKQIAGIDLPAIIVCSLNKRNKYTTNFITSQPVDIQTWK
jgi:hypothetical protein